MGANVKLGQMTDNGTYGAFHHTLEAVFSVFRTENVIRNASVKSEHEVGKSSELNQEGCDLFLSELYFTQFNREYFDLVATLSVLCVKLH